jgi:TRAP transporter TAXI family solute receptor
VSATAASVQNLRLVGTGQAEVGFALADSAADAVLGRGSFDRPLPVVALARIYDNYLQLVVRAGGPVHTLADLRGRRVDTGAAASGTEVTAARVLAVAGLDPTRDLRRSRLGLDDVVAALAAGRIDAFFWSGGLPTAAVARLARAVPLRLVPLDGTVRALRERFGDFYVETAVPAAAYGLADAVGTVGVPNYLMVGTAMPAATAYRLTRLLFDRRPELVAAHPEARRLNLRSAIATYPVPLHPGAERCYRELSR